MIFTTPAIASELEATMRRQFIKTKVRYVPIPRKLTVVEPPEPLLEVAPKLIPAAAGCIDNISCAEIKPLFVMKSEEITVTELALAISVLLIRESVTAIRSTSSTISLAITCTDFYQLLTILRTLFEEVIFQVL